MLEEIIEEVKESMDKAIESLRRDLSSIRTGRASAAMLDNVRVDYYGQQTRSTRWRRSASPSRACWRSSPGRPP